MSITVESFMVISLAFAVFAAITAVGAAILLSVGYERLRSGLHRLKEGLDMVTRQTGFFSEAIHKLDEKVTAVDAQTQRFSTSLDSLQGNVERVDKQTGYFADAINRLETKVKSFEQIPDQINIGDLMKNPKAHDLMEENSEEAPSLMTVTADSAGSENTLDYGWNMEAGTATEGMDIPSSFLQSVTGGGQNKEITFH
jgi:uncharacterized phage infection (PIP) family protein YhgE